jgi:hypothetical protein
LITRRVSGIKTRYLQGVTLTEDGANGIVLGRRREQDGRGREMILFERDNILGRACQGGRCAATGYLSGWCILPIDWPRTGMVAWECTQHGANRNYSDETSPSAMTIIAAPVIIKGCYCHRLSSMMMIMEKISSNTLPEHVINMFHQQCRAR